MTTQTKQLLVRSAKNAPTLYEVYFEEGGELPAELDGALFTHKVLAQEAANIYLSKKQEKKSGTTGNKSRAN